MSWQRGVSLRVPYTLHRARLNIWHSPTAQLHEPSLLPPPTEASAPAAPAGALSWTDAAAQPCRRCRGGASHAAHGLTGALVAFPSVAAARRCGRGTAGAGPTATWQLAPGVACMTEHPFRAMPRLTSCAELRSATVRRRTALSSCSYVQPWSCLSTEASQRQAGCAVRTACVGCSSANIRGAKGAGAGGAAACAGRGHHSAGPAVGKTQLRIQAAGVPPQGCASQSP